MILFGRKIPHLVVLLAGAAVCALFLFGATQSAFAAATNKPYDGSTCGTYRGDHVAGGDDDPGVNPPFAKSGIVTPACVSSVPSNGNNVCHFENPKDCILASPTPPLMVASNKWCVNSDPPVCQYDQSVPCTAPSDCIPHGGGACQPSGNRVICRDDGDCTTAGTYWGPCVLYGTGSDWYTQFRWYLSNDPPGQLFPVQMLDVVMQMWEESANPIPDFWKCFYYYPGAPRHPECSGKSNPIANTNLNSTSTPGEWLSGVRSANYGAKYFYTASATSCRRSLTVNPGSCLLSSWQYCENDIDFACTDSTSPQPSPQCAAHGVGGNCVQNHTPFLRSEIRWVNASTEDYTLTVTPPADTHVVTGKTSDEYTVNLTTSSTLTGNVTLSVEWDVPVPNGVTIQWTSGNTISLASPAAKFKVATTDGTTAANKYTLRAKGTHPLAGDHNSIAPDPTLTVQDYSMGNPSADPLVMNPTDSKTLTVTLGWLPAFDPLTQPVTVSATNYPWLVKTFAPSPIASPNTVLTATLTTTNAPPGDYAFTITGTAAPSGLVRTVAITIHINPPPDFTIAVTPMTATVNQGNAQAYTVTITPVNGFASPVNLSVTGLHATMTGTFGSNPLPVAGVTTTTLAVTTQLPGTPCGGAPYTLIVRGIAGALNHATATNLSVNCVVLPDFTFNANPLSVSVPQGTPATFTVTAVSTGGYNGTVNLDCIGMAGCVFGSGVTSFSVTPATPGNIVLTVPTGALAVQAHPFDIQGSDGPLVHKVTVTINVTAPPLPPDFTFDVIPNPLTITEGQNDAYTLLVSPLNGFSALTTVTWVSTPALPGSVTFIPGSGLSMNPGTRTVQVQTAAGSAGTYSLDFTATSGSIPPKTKNNVQLVINPIPSVCGAGCAANETCTSTGCQPDPVAAGRCNGSNCYKADGSFSEPASPGCWKSWQRCESYSILKVKKDRQCDQWLSCASSTTVVDAQGKEQTQCTALDVCDQLGPEGQCLHHFTASTTPSNMAFNSPGDVTGIDSLIRWYSGYSSGFHFSSFTPASVNPTSAVIASTYKPQDIKETGLGGAQINLVQNGTFEELRCTGGKRDGLACITTSDCRVDQGVCADAQSPDPVTAASTLPCSSDADCADAKTTTTKYLPYCRYVASWGGDVDCRNPVDSKWLGITPPSATTADNYEEAGYGSTTTSNYVDFKRQGKRISIAGDELVVWHVWEDEANFEDQTTKLAGASSPRFPDYSLFKHLKDTNNVLKVVVQPKAKEFSGVGVRVADTGSPLATGVETKYTLSFKFKNGANEGTPVGIKAQLSFNYTPDASGGYEKTDAIALDFPGITINTTATGWKEYVSDPLTISSSLGYDRSQPAFLTFVSTSAGSATPTIFYLDDVSLKPVLDTGTADSGRPVTKIARSCRLFPQNSSPGCEYRDPNGALYRGWRGYCLDKDPKNSDLCLTWWPLDLPAGEDILGAVKQTAYTGRYPLFQCLEESGGAGVYDFTTAPTHFFGKGGFSIPMSVLGSDIRWRDIFSIEVYAFFFGMSGDYDNKFICKHGSPGYDLCGVGTSGAKTSEDVALCSCNEFLDGSGGQSSDFYWRLHLNTINRVPGDNGIRMIQNRKGQPAGGMNIPWSSLVSTGAGCTGGAQYAAVKFGFNNSANPNASDAKVSSIDAFICDDDDTNDGYVGFRYVIRMKPVCNYVIQTVKDELNGPVEKVWTSRLKSASQYGVPDYNPLGFYTPNIRYSSDVPPYGAVSTNAGGTPDTWEWVNNDDQSSPWGEPQGSVVREPQSTTTLRMGTPYSFAKRPPIRSGACNATLRVCQTNDTIRCETDDDCTNIIQAKYCTMPTYQTHPAGSFAAGGGYGPFESVLGINRCETNRDLQMCERAGGSCLGSPIGRCSLRQTVMCGSNADCKSTITRSNFDAGTCSNYRCTTDRTLTCTQDGDCKNITVKPFDYGTCTAPTTNSGYQSYTSEATGPPDVSGNPTLLADDGVWRARGRLSRLFAQTHGCWEYTAELKDGLNGGKRLAFSYQQQTWKVGDPLPMTGACTSLIGMGRALGLGPMTPGPWVDWDIYDPTQDKGTGFVQALQCDSDPATPGIDNTRPTKTDGAPDYDNEYCWVRPTIGDPTLGGGTGDITIKQGTMVTANFTADTDKDQKPLDRYRVLWTYPNSSPPTPQACWSYNNGLSEEEWKPIYSPAKIQDEFDYSKTPLGDYHPVVCVYDHWKVVSVKQYAGKVTVIAP